MPADPSKTIFISYRRDVSSFHAIAIEQNLRAKGYDVFMDTKSLSSGEFAAFILQQIAARAHFLIICTRGTFNRCSEPEDWIRREIEHALDTKRNIVPILIEDFQFDEKVMKHLTGKLAKLSDHNGLLVPRGYFEESMNRLRKQFLKQSVGGKIVPTPTSDEPLVAAKQAEVAAQPSPTPEQLAAEQHLIKGIEKFETYDYDGAITEYDEAIRLHASLVSAYHNRGVVYWELEKFESAIQDFTKALRHDPSFALSYITRGNAYLKLGDLERAEQDQSEAIRLMPDDSTAYYNRARVYERKGDFEAAIKDYSVSLRSSSDLMPSDIVYHARGRLYLMQGNFDAAIADYSAVIDTTDSILSAYVYRAYAKLQKRDFEGAIEDSSRVIQRAVALAEPYNTRADAYARKGDYAAALADYEKYLELGGGEQFDNRGEIEGKIQDLKRKLDKQQKT